MAGSAHPFSAGTERRAHFRGLNICSGHSSLKMRFSEHFLSSHQRALNGHSVKREDLPGLVERSFKWLTARYCWSGADVNGR